MISPFRSNLAIHVAIVLLISAFITLEAKDEDKIGNACAIPSQLLDCGMLICRQGRCSVCLNDAECQASFSKFVCSNNMCVHKRLFPMYWSDAVATVLVFFLVALAAGSGIGGGSALVPIYVLVSGFVPSSAVPLSKATILGGAVSNLIINSKKRHPSADRPLIDYHTATLFVPTQLLGTMIGVLCNKVWPNWVISVFLVFFLAWLAYVTCRKGLDVHNREIGAPREVEEKETLLKTTPTPEKKTVINWGKPPGKIRLEQTEEQEHAQNEIFKSPSGNGGDIVGVIPKAELDKQRRSETGRSTQLEGIYNTERVVPWKKLVLLWSLWLFVVIISLIKGGEGGSIAGVVCASSLYWSIFIVPFPIILTITMALAYERIRMFKRKLDFGFDFEPGDVKWTRKNSLLYPTACIGVGFAAGALGIGGGAMTGPLMLHMNMHPQVVTATAAFMILFTSSITTAQFIIYGVLEPTYAVWFCGLGFVASIVGQFGMAYVINKYNKLSLVIFSIALVLGVSSVMMCVNGTVSIVSALNNHLPMGFRPLCSAG